MNSRTLYTLSIQRQGCRT